jgi:glucan-binding YG repeat protein
MNTAALAKLFRNDQLSDAYLVIQVASANSQGRQAQPTSRQSHDATVKEEEHKMQEQQGEHEEEQDEQQQQQKQEQQDVQDMQRDQEDKKLVKEEEEGHVYLQLQRFPVHKVVLCTGCEYFMSQVRSTSEGVGV